MEVNIHRKSQSLIDGEQVSCEFGKLGYSRRWSGYVHARDFWNSSAMILPSRQARKTKTWRERTRDECVSLVTSYMDMNS